jgi:hypothetical protein
MQEVLGRERYSPFLCDFQGAVEVCTIPQRDGGHDKVERHSIEILFDQSSGITKAQISRVLGWRPIAALQEQRGLRLQPAKGPVEILVINQVAKTPTDN